MNLPVDYSHDFETMMHLHVTEKENAERLSAHYQLYKKADELQGCIIRSGIAAENIPAFALFRHFIVHNASKQVIAFQKPSTSMCFSKSNNGSLVLSKQVSTTEGDTLRQKLTENRVDTNEFIEGNVCDAIPQYLTNNPELRIAYLHIDLDDYDAALTTLQFLYPRLVQGGLLVLDNHYKKEDDYRAVLEYFCDANVTINNFSLKQGPHYLVKH